jgi:hypothetical protein
MLMFPHLQLLPQLLLSFHHPTATAFAQGMFAR